MNWDTSPTLPLWHSSRPTHNSSRPVHLWHWASWAGPTDPYCWVLVIPGYILVIPGHILSHPWDTFCIPMTQMAYIFSLAGFFIFSLAGFFIFAYTFSYAPAHSFPVDRHGVPSTLHIVFLNCWYLSLDHREIEAIPSLPSTRPVHSLPSPHHLT